MSYAVHATFADTLTPSTAQKKQRVRVQGAKCKTTPLRYRHLYGLPYDTVGVSRRWARSTMVLVPLFGTHYALFLVFSVGIERHEVLEVVWLLLDQTFASFQVSQGNMSKLWPLRQGEINGFTGVNRIRTF